MSDLFRLNCQQHIALDNIVSGIYQFFFLNLGMRDCSTISVLWVARLPRTDRSSQWSGNTLHCTVKSLPPPPPIQHSYMTQYAIHNTRLTLLKQEANEVLIRSYRNKIRWEPRIKCTKNYIFILKYIRNKINQILTHGLTQHANTHKHTHTNTHTHTHTHIETQIPEQKLPLDLKVTRINGAREAPHSLKRKREHLSRFSAKSRKQRQIQPNKTLHSTSKDTVHKATGSKIKLRIPSTIQSY
jgi:hypothetical protein